MATNAIQSHGIVYQIDDGTDGDTFVTIGEVRNITLPSDEREEIDVTHYGSPADTRETIGGLINAGTCEFTINWIPSDATDIFLRGLRLSGATRKHKLTFPTGTVMEFPGFIQGYSPSAEIGDALQCSFTIKKAGAETWDDPTP